MLFLMLMDNANPDFKGTPLFNIDTAKFPTTRSVARPLCDI